MITVHHLEYSRSQRVLWLLEELEVPYEIVRYQRDPKTMLAPKSLEAIHPLGKSPVIVEDGATIAESGAIIEYLVDKHGKGKFTPAAGTPEFARYRYFMHYAEGSLMPVLLMKLVTMRIATAPMPFFVRPIARKIAGTLSSQFVAPNLTRHIAFLAGELANRPWIAGNEMTAADIQMSYPLEALAARGGDDVPAKIRELVTKFQARPAYKRAVERGGPSELPGS
jgi:glutathione S-transferase